MDNLTHSLVGALIGQAGLKRRTGLAMPALIIGANLPDIDAACFLWLDGVEHLAFRRGITHGPPAMILLPLVLAGLLWAFDRWQTMRGKRPETRLPVHFGWLYALSFIGCLSHPALDWLNVYGVRLLEPFSRQWYYGDTLFIVDLWLWLGLGLATWLSLRSERRGGIGRRPARAALGIACLYIFANGIVTGLAERDGAALVKHAYGIEPTLVVGSPRPILSWERQILWRWDDPALYGAVHGEGVFSPFGGTTLFEPAGRDQRATAVTWSSASRDRRQLVQTFAMTQPRLARLIECNRGLEAFLFWSRMPIVHPNGSSGSESAVFHDQRFRNPVGGDRFSVMVDPCEQLRAD